LRTLRMEAFIDFMDFFPPFFVDFIFRRIAIVSILFLLYKIPIFDEREWVRVNVLDCNELRKWWWWMLFGRILCSIFNHIR
jgi:hypothetical protein